LPARSKARSRQELANGGYNATGGVETAPDNGEELMVIPAAQDPVGGVES
jgi:hypothetical protein